MKRNIYILSLALLFFVSTTGLPLTLHLCKMNPDAEMCGMCSSEPVEVKSCCSMETDYPVKFTASEEACCEVKVVDSSVKDDFLFSKVETNKEVLVQIISPEIIFTSELNSINKVFYSDTSPPGLENNHIYLSNSVFLI